MTNSALDVLREAMDAASPDMVISRSLIGDIIEGVNPDGGGSIAPMLAGVARAVIALEGRVVAAESRLAQIDGEGQVDTRL